MDHPNAPLPDAGRATPAPPSALLLGACSLHELIGPLRPRFAQVSQAWRRPTIALMAPALPPDSVRPPAGTPTRIAAYILADAAKAQRAALLRSRDDLFLFELIRDLITGVVRLGDSWVANPDQLLGLPGMRPLEPDPLGPARRLGLDQAPEGLDFRDGGFLAVWRDAFRRFREEVLAPRLARGGRVVLYSATFTEAAVGPVDPAWIAEPGLAAHANALLGTMEAEALALPGVEVVGAPHALRVTAADVAWGGPAYTHYIPEAYAFAADRLSALLSGGGGGAEAPGPAVVAGVLRRAATGATLAASLADAAAGSEASREEVARLRARLAEAEALAERLRAATGRNLPLLRRIGRALVGGN